MAKGISAEQKTRNIWKVSVILISAVIFAYLVFRTVNDARWIYNDINSTLLVAALICIAAIIYVLKVKGRKGKV